MIIMRAIEYGEHKGEDCTVVNRSTSYKKTQLLYNNIDVCMHKILGRR